MATLHHLDMALIDIRHRLSTELQLSVDSERQIESALETAFEAMNHLHAVIKQAFVERRRALATAVGNPGPQPETIEQHATEAGPAAEPEPAPRKPPKLVKAAGGEA